MKVAENTSIKIENKSSNPGYIWVPYLIRETAPAVIDVSFIPKKVTSNSTVSSKFYSNVTITKNKTRCKKLKKILNEFELQR